MSKVKNQRSNVVGILALQGDFREHEEMLSDLGATPLQVRLPEDVDKIDRLIIPGGESTTIGKLLTMYDLLDPIKKRASDGMPIWGTCAGAILLATHIADPAPGGQTGLGLMDITARRNAYGRQLDSFEVDVAIGELGSKPFPCVFIRAPILEDPGKNVKVLATHNGKIIFARESKLLASCFHPELTDDTRLHEYFLRM